MYLSIVHCLSSGSHGGKLVTFYQRHLLLALVGKSGRLGGQDGDPNDLDCVDPKQSVLHRNDAILYGRKKGNEIGKECKLV